MKNNTEIELKLQVGEPAVWKDLLSSSLWSKWGDVKWQKTRMEAAYFDTPSRALNNERIAYRVRREGEKYVATVKSGGSSQGGLHTRQEWNVDVLGSGCDISVFQDTEIWPKLKELAGSEPLMPLFVTDFTRLTLEISTSDGAVVEIAADRGEIITGEKRSPILELELELKKGEPASILILGAELTKEYPLYLEWRSKYYRAMELAGLIPAKPQMEYAAAQAEALKNIQSLLNLQPALYKSCHDVRRANALLLELWAELIR